MRHATVWPRLLPWLVGLAFLLLYAATAAPSIVTLFDDSLEFQLVLPTFAIAHPTGYPLFTLLGGLWSRVLFPVGNWAWRANLFSALAAATTVALVFVLTGRLLADVVDRRSAAWAGLAAAITFGLGPVWWAQATIAEVYALHNLLVCAILVTAVGIEHARGRAFDRRLALLWLLVGVGLAHHRTIVLVLPGLAIYLLWSVTTIWRPRRIWWLWLAALAAPLLIYLYLPLRAGMGARDLHGSYVNTWTGFWDHVLARAYTSFFAASPLAVDRTPGDWLQLGLAQLGWMGALLALIGLAWLANRSVRKGWALILFVLLANVLFALLYRVGDQEVFLLPAFLCTGVLAGGGVAWVAQWAPVRWRWVAGLAGVVLLLAGAGRGGWVNRSQAWAAHDYAVDMAKVDFPPGSHVIGLEGELTALKYMQQAEGLGLAATPVVADDPAQRRAALAAAVMAGAPTYLTRELEGIDGQYSFTGDGPLVRVWPRGQAETGAAQHPLAVVMNDRRLALDGYDLQRLEWVGGPALRVALYWQPTAQITQTLKVSLRLLGEDGTPVTNADGSPVVLDQLPLRQVAPTPTWAPGERLRDIYDLRLPPAFAGAATLQVILYDAATLEEAGRVELPISN